MAVALERMEKIEERVDRLESLFGQFMAQTGMVLRRIDRSIERIDRTVERIEATVAEMKADAARDREESARFREESARDRAEMKADAALDREESARFRARSEQDSREMNKRWGELANKMGTLVEDIIAPSLRRMGREELGCGEERLFVERISRTRSDNPKLRREFDALYVGSQAVLLNETKSTARPEYAREFVAFVNSGEFGLYFPEFREMPIVPVFSSLQIHPDLVTHLTRNGIYAVAMSEEAMQILNLTELRPESVEK